MSLPSPTNLAPYIGAFTAIGSLAALIALHRLRPQRHARPVPTLLFYRAAARPDTARVLGGSFSRRATFLLLALMCALLAAAICLAPWQPHRAGGPAVIVVDAGCELDGPAWDQLRCDAVTTLNRLPSGQGIAVVLAKAEPTVLAGNGTLCPVSADRLNKAGIDHRPSQSAAALLLAQDMAPTGDIVWFTGLADIPAEVPPTIRKRILIHHLPLPRVATLTDVVFVPDPTDLSRGQLSVQAAAGAGITVTARCDGDSRTASITSAGTATFDGIAANGARWSIQLPDAPGPQAMHTVEFTVPRQTRPKFDFDPATPPALRQALAATFGQGPATDQTCTVGIAPAAGDIVIVPDAQTSAARCPLTRGGVTTGSTITAFTGLSVQPDSVPMLSAGDATLAAFVPAAGNHPAAVWLSAALFDANRCDLPLRAAFPLLIRTCCQQLGYITAASPTILADRLAQDPLWSRANTLPAPAVTFNPKPTAGDTSPLPLAASWSIRPSELLLGCAVILLTAEGLLFAFRKIA